MHFDQRLGASQAFCKSKSSFSTFSDLFLIQTETDKKVKNTRKNVSTSADTQKQADWFYLILHETTYILSVITKHPLAGQNTQLMI